MQRDLIVKGRSLGGTSDLTLLAPIKPGFAEALESVTYKTRIKRVLETLHGARMASHEHATARLLTDSIERVGVIHSVRVAVFEPEDKVLLSVTFDGSWEAYIRVLWDKVGTLLDLIFCSTVGYVTAYDHSFEEWLEWARRVQVETGFFYGPPDATARDVLYHRRIERMRQRGNDTTLNELRAVLPSADEVVERLLGAGHVIIGDRVPADEPPYDWGTLPSEARERVQKERMRTGLRSLAGLYQLTDLFRPATPDGEVLRLAARDLLKEFIQLKYRIPEEWKEEGVGQDPRPGEPRVPGRFLRQITWLEAEGATVKAPRPPAPDPKQLDADEIKRELADIQGGIIETYTDITHGAMLMLRFDGREGARAFFEWTKAHVTSAAAPHAATAKGEVFRNVGLTAAGLRAAGLTEDEIELLPEEFRQGMAARAGLLGDVRTNHPKRWRLPPRLPADATEPADDAFVIDLESVHAAVVLKWAAAPAPAGQDASGDTYDAATLQEELRKIRGISAQVSVLAMQTLERRFREVADPDHPGQTTQRIAEHFGYADGDGQPALRHGDRPFSRNLVHLGELIHGYPNAADPQAPGPGAAAGDAAGERLRWLRNGSFLVVRKYRQFPDRLEQAVKESGAPQELVYAKLMGRDRDGKPLVPGRGLNNFTFDNDRAGELCPLHAHIRLAHPRLEQGIMARPPRLMRRSMSYGPAYAPGSGDDGQDRGLLFMAYNAHLGEQYEVVQRWLNGGNSTGSSSGQGCPIVGVPDNGYPRHFRFEHKPDPKAPDDDASQVVRVRLEAPTQLFDEPASLTRLEWGMYLLAPSLSVLGRLAGRAAAASAASAAAVPWQAHRGRQAIEALRKLEAQQGAAAALQAWKAAIEDPAAIDRHESASLWAAIREDHGGVLRTPYGVLVASRELLHEVLLDPDQRYSVSGQMERMKRSFGPISLGLDAGADYDEQSKPVNDAIGDLTATAVGKERVFGIAFGAANRRIDQILAHARKNPKTARIETGFDAREILDEVLADLCEYWFGLQDGMHLRRGGDDHAWKDRVPPLPLYPGHFTAPSRYMFQPHPGAMPTELGEEYGVALRTAMRAFVKDWRDRGDYPRAPDKSVAPVARAAFDHPLGVRKEPRPDEGDDFVARVMVGVLMGFIPTIIGATLNVLREWQRDGTLWTLRTRLADVPGDGGSQARERAHAVLRSSMGAASRMRPMPPVGWRTVRKAHRLGTGPHGVDLAVDDKVVLGTASGTQQALAEGEDDGLLMFGGDRRRTPHPTHACPGYLAGIEAMLGALAAIVSRPETLRQGAGWLNFVLEEDAPPALPAVPAQLKLRRQLQGGLKSSQPSMDIASLSGLEIVQRLDAVQGLEGLQGLPQVSKLDTPARLKFIGQRLEGLEVLDAGDTPAWFESHGAFEAFDALKLALDSKAPAREARLAKLPTNRSGLVWCWGDSWLHYKLETTADLRDVLGEFGYRAPDTFCHWDKWGRAEILAGSDAFTKALNDLFETSDVLPRALIVSCGGNDSVGPRLSRMLNRFGSATFFDGKEHDALLADLDRWYATTLAPIGETLRMHGSNAPVLVHGYDHPFPAHRGYWGLGPKKWMYEPFEDAGYDLGNEQHAQRAADAMRDLINDLNTRLKTLSRTPPFNGFVRHVDFTGTLAANWDRPTDGWVDGLHPTTDGFRLMAAQLDAIIHPGE